MIPNVESALNSIVGSVVALKHAQCAGRAFELFVMTSLALGLRDAGFQVWLQRSDGSTIEPRDPVSFIQRGGAPTGVPPASDGPNNASVIGLQKGGQKWEIWNGVQFEGRSSATHEIDISIVPGSVRNAIRATGGIPVGRPRVAIECKHVGAAGSLDETRAFIARLYDLTLLRAHHRHLHLTPARAVLPGSHSTMTYLQENRRTKNIIARRTGFTGGTKPLVKYHEIEPHRDISVGSGTVDELVTSVVNWMMRNA